MDLLTFFRLQNQGGAIGEPYPGTTLRVAILLKLKHLLAPIFEARFRTFFSLHEGTVGMMTVSRNYAGPMAKSAPIR